MRRIHLRKFTCVNCKREQHAMPYVGTWSSDEVLLTIGTRNTILRNPDDPGTQFSQKASLHQFRLRVCANVVGTSTAAGKFRHTTCLPVPTDLCANDAVVLADTACCNPM